MMTHSLIMAYRTLKRFKATFFINLIGLSAGLACAILIYLWVHDELNMDRFHQYDGRLYQVMTNMEFPAGIRTREDTPGRLPEALKREMPEVVNAVAVNPWSSTPVILRVGNRFVKARDFYAGKEFFNVFSYPLLQGDKNRVLNDKRSVAISDELARKLFNTTENVIGRTVSHKRAEQNETFLVSGVFRKPPANSTAQFDVVFSYDLQRERSPEIDEWFNGGCITYVVLKEGADIAAFDAKIRNFLMEKGRNGFGFLFTRPYAAKHLYDKYENGKQTGGRILYVKLFSIIAVFILLIACINFMNLSTAKASRRLKEVGIKKAIGADRQSLIFQFLGESVFMALVSLLLAIVLVAVLLPGFNQITGKSQHLTLDASLILMLLGVTLLTGLVAGSYPALYLSGFNPITVLKGKLNASTGELWARKGLVLFQFTISVVLIVSVLVVYKQVDYVQSKNLGYDRDNVIMFKTEGGVKENFATFLARMKQIPGVLNVSSTWGNMTKADNYTDDLDWEGKNPDEKPTIANLQVNYDFVETMGIELKEGRSFSPKYSTDTSKLIFNEAAIALMGLKDPVGKIVRRGGKDWQIIGVVKNFHFESLYEDMKPLFLVLSPKADNIMAKVKAGTERETIERIGQLYQKYNQGVPFDYKFLDQDYAALYASENRVAVLSKYFAGVAIFIACMGLYSLAAFTAERKLKEIGIRKVLGATNLGIAGLLTREFITVVFAAILVALPVSYLVAKSWLNDFAYRINLEWWFFVVAGLAALSIAWLTVASQTIKAAWIKPTESLRKE